MAILLDTTGVPARERGEAVRAALVAATAPCHVVHEHPDREIHCRMELWEFGNATVFTNSSTGIQLLRTARQAGRTGQDASPVVALSVQRRADARHEQLARRRVVRPGELLMTELSAPYAFSWSGNGAAACVQMPADEIGLPLDVIRRAGGGLPKSPLYRLVADHILHLTRDAARLSADPGAAALGAATVELARALLASAAQQERGSRAALAGTLLTRVRAYVRQHLADPHLRPETIAAAHHISVRYLYKLCSQADFSLEQWIISQRLQGAREELTRPESRHRSLAMVARRWGFSDPSHFGRRFRSAYGLSPSEWRCIAAHERGC